MSSSQSFTCPDPCNLLCGRKIGNVGIMELSIKWIHMCVILWRKSCLYQLDVSFLLWIVLVFVMKESYGQGTSTNQKTRNSVITDLLWENSFIFLVFCLVLSYKGIVRQFWIPRVCVCLTIIPASCAKEEFTSWISSDVSYNVRSRIGQEN